VKIHRLIAIVVAVLFAAPALAQGPSPNNAVWGVSDQNQVFRWQPVPSWAGSLEQRLLSGTGVMGSVM
jgi:hypothetical protein